MKKVITEPAVILSITCPACNSTGKIKGKEVFNKDLKVNCPKCKEKFIAMMNTRDYYRKKITIQSYYSMNKADKPSGKTKPGTIVNLSRYGCLLETSRYSSISSIENEGNILSLMFSLPPKNKQLQLKGKIIRIGINSEKSTAKIGIKFINPSEFETSQIGFFLM